MLPFILSLSFGYLFGTVPFGLILCRMAGYGDIRQIGSGNIGATNVLRTGNKPLAALTLILDASKGALAAMLAFMFAGLEGALAAGLGAVIGHMFPVWLGFKGGKGVSTTLGTLLVALPPVGFLAIFCWLAAAFAFKISSLAALIATGLAPFIALLIYKNLTIFYFCAAMCVLVWMRHAKNIARLLRAEEPKIGQKKDG